MLCEVAQPGRQASVAARRHDVPPLPVSHAGPQAASDRTEASVSARQDQRTALPLARRARLFISAIRALTR